MLKEVFGDKAIGQTQTYEWFKRFKNRWMLVDDEEHSWLHSTRTMTKNVAKVWHWRHFAEGICSTRTDGELKILLWRSEVNAEKHTVQTSRHVAQQLLGPESWQCSSSCVARCAAVFGFYEHDSHHPPSLLNGSCPVIFSYSQRWNWNTRGDVLTALKRSRPNSRTRCKRWHEMTSRSASNHGNPAGIAVSMPKGLPQRGCRWIEISVSAIAEEFQELLGSTSYTLELGILK